MGCRACEKAFETNCDMCGEQLVISKKDGDFCCGVDAKQTEVINALVESAEHILGICEDVPDQHVQIPEPNKHLTDLIEIKKVVKQMIKFAKARS